MHFFNCPWCQPGLIEDDLWSFRPPSTSSATINILSRNRYVDFLILKISNNKVIKNLEHFLKSRLDQRF